MTLELAGRRASGCARALPEPQNRQIIQKGPGCRRASRRGWPPGGRRPRLIGRRPRLIEHFGPARRKDGPPMLLGQGGLPQPWAIDVVATTTMSHRCGCLAWPSSIDGPPLRSRPRDQRRIARFAANPAKRANWIMNRDPADPPRPGPDPAWHAPGYARYRPRGRRKRGTPAPNTSKTGETTICHTRLHGTRLTGPP